MEKSTRLGINRTGTHMSPLNTQSMEKIARANFPEMHGEDTTLIELREAYIMEAERIGSVPLPGTVKGMMKAGMGLLTGEHPEVLVDKLGERLAFERTGTRLYDALILKHHAFAQQNKSEAELIPIEELQQFRSEEAQHFLMVAEMMESLGADPTAETPCADISGVASAGIIQVLNDPRTDFMQCLNAILTAELADNAGWELLIQLMESLGYNDKAEHFRFALHEENVHLQTVKRWLKQLILREAL